MCFSLQRYHFTTHVTIYPPLFCARSLPCMLCIEFLGHVPALAWLDRSTMQDLPAQLPFLFAGALFYGFALTLACRTAERRFERVDL